MLRTRLWMGSILILLAVGMLVVDQYAAPWFPFLFVVQIALGLLAAVELTLVLGPNRSPQKAILPLGVLVLAACNWLPHLLPQPGHPWSWILGGFVGLLLLSFLYEMARFQVPDRSVERMSLTLWILAYVGLLPSFLAQLRWLFPAEDVVKGSMALAFTIFVPKSCDIGAYFTGRLLGRHPLTPVLSPKKTLEGALGGLTAAVLVAVALDRLGPVPLLGACWYCELVYGLLLGGAGMLGDLAESLIKRDCRTKDASQVVPGFGGILDVVDAILFAAPVSYLCFAVSTRG